MLCSSTSVKLCTRAESCTYVLGHVFTLHHGATCTRRVKSRARGAARGHVSREAGQAAAAMTRRVVRFGVVRRRGALDLLSINDLSTRHYD